VRAHPPTASPSGPSLARAEGAVAVAAIVANAAQHLLPFRARLVSNLGAATAAVLIAHESGIAWSDLGLDRDHLAEGIRWGVGAGAVIIAAVVAAGTSERTRHRFIDARVRGHGPGRAAYELVARIPLETALAEEMIFRSALLGIALQRRSPAAAVATASLLFGLWHVVPTWAEFDGSAVGAAAGERPSARLGAVVGVVLATAGAGAGFAALRLRSGSVLAPVIAHATLNITTFALARRAADTRTPGPPSEGPQA
jgi:membrane protease YdiL (CAAX protease family)